MNDNINPAHYKRLPAEAIEIIEDLKKAKWYLDRLIDSFEANEPEQPVVKQSLTPEPPDGWRWLEIGEVIRKGDQGFEKGLFHAIDSLIGMALQAHWRPTIRRNRFEVGEKVVRIFNGAVYKVIHILSMGYQLESEFCAEVIVHGKDLAPYIEETK